MILLSVEGDFPSPTLWLEKVLLCVSQLLAPGVLELVTRNLKSSLCHFAPLARSTRLSLHLLYITAALSESCTACTARRFGTFFFFLPGCRLNPAFALLPVIFCLSRTHTQTLLVSSFTHLGPCLVFGNPLPWERNHPQHFHHLCTHALVSPSLFFLSPQGRLLRPLKGDLFYDSIVIELGHIWLPDSHHCCLKTTPKRLDLVC